MFPFPVGRVILRDRDLSRFTPSEAWHGQRSLRGGIRVARRGAGEAAGPILIVRFLRKHGVLIQKFASWRVFLFRKDCF